MGWDGDFSGFFCELTNPWSSDQKKWLNPGWKLTTDNPQSSTYNAHRYQGRKTVLSTKGWFLTSSEGHMNWAVTHLPQRVRQSQIVPLNQELDLLIKRFKYDYPNEPITSINASGKNQAKVRTMDHEEKMMKWRSSTRKYFKFLPVLLKQSSFFLISMGRGSYIHSSYALMHKHTPWIGYFSSHIMVIVPATGA